MKKIKPSIHSQNRYRISFWLTILLFLLIFHGFSQGKSEFSELVSLNIRNAPLAEVLDNVSQASGYEFIIDENWGDLSITVKFDAIPLDQALKRILASVNHAIIYKSDRKVLIRIYANDASVFRHTGTSTIKRNPHEPVLQSQEIETPTSSNPVPLEPSIEEAQSEEAESEEAESEDSELSSRQPETPDG